MLQFVADGVFFAELNELFTRELAEDGYSGVEVRVTPVRTEVIIRATRTQNVLGDCLMPCFQFPVDIWKCVFFFICLCLEISNLVSLFATILCSNSVCCLQVLYMTTMCFFLFSSLVRWFG